MTPIALVELVADALQDVCDELVFVGGAITGLLITDSAAPPPSATKDVDVIVSVTAPYFIATKLEAFRSRGAGDYMGSKDIEDLAAVLHGREEVVADVLAVSTELRAYLSEHAAELLGSRAFRQSLEGHLPGEDRTLVTQRLEQIVTLQDPAR